MTLEQIDNRLTLFKDYLRYWLDNKVYDVPLRINIGALPDSYSVNDVLRIFQQTGYLYVVRDERKELLSFDQWLIHNGHRELTDYCPEMHIGFDPYEKDCDTSSMVTWVKDHNGAWRILH